MTKERVIDLAEDWPDVIEWLQGADMRYMKWVGGRPVYCDKEGIPIRSEPLIGVDISTKP